MYQPLIKFHPYPAIITQVLRIFAEDRRRFGNLCVQARTIAYTPFTIAAVMGNKFHPLHYLCPKQNGL